MQKQVYKVDESGYLQEILVKEFSEHGDCTEELAENIIVTDVPQGLYRARWNGTEWIEDMAQEEIDELNNQSRELPLELRNRADIDYIAIVTGVDL